MKRMCRVYGRDFASRRVDAITCTPTCRQRLSRGQAFAYLAGLSKREQKVHREMHAGYDRLIATVKRRNAFLKDLRAEKRAEKQERERQRDPLPRKRATQRHQRGGDLRTNSGSITETATRPHH